MSHSTPLRAIPDGTDDVAAMPPYAPERVDALAADLADYRCAETVPGWTSEGGQAGRVFTISTAWRSGSTSARHAFHVWVIARERAFAAGSSWAAEGLVRWAVSDDREAIALRRAALLHVVPLLDVDGAAGVAGGPDLSADWSLAPGRRPATKGVRAVLHRMNAAPEVHLFIALDCANGDGTETRLVVEESRARPRGFDDHAARFAGLLRGATTHSPVPYGGRIDEVAPGGNPYPSESHRAVLRRWWPEARFSGALVLAGRAGIPAFVSIGRNLGRAICRFLPPPRS